MYVYIYRKKENKRERERCICVFIYTHTYKHQLFLCACLPGAASPCDFHDAGFQRPQLPGEFLDLLHFFARAPT